MGMIWVAWLGYNRLKHTDHRKHRGFPKNVGALRMRFAPDRQTIEDELLTLFEGDEYMIDAWTFEKIDEDEFLLRPIGFFIKQRDKVP